MKDKIIRMDPSKLYGRDAVVSRRGVNDADLTKPVSFMKDRYGHVEVIDGQHRAKKAFNLGQFIAGIFIGTRSDNNDLSRDEYKHKIPDIKEIDD